MIKQFDHLFKTVIIGNSGVGKSAILVRFSENQFIDHYLATIGVDFRFKTMTVDQKNVKFQIWDTAGQERFRTITSAYYRGSQAVLLVFDITDAQSFKDICQFWMSEVENYAEKDALLFLIGNKSDLINYRAVSNEQINKFCSPKHIAYFECSAKQDEKIKDIFIQMARSLMKKIDPKRIVTSSKGNELNKKQKQKNKKCCGN